MRKRYGEEAERIMIEGGPHVMIFPNLFIAEIQCSISNRSPSASAYSTPPRFSWWVQQS